jgi:predicted dehydrogenase
VSAHASSSAPARTATLRLAISGCGRIAERGYLPALRRLRGLSLMAVADPHPTRREGLRAAAAALDGGRPPAAYDSFERLLAQERPDAVVIATPTDLHVEQASLAAGAGIPALVEKPPASTLAEATRLAELQPRPWIGFNRRFTAAARIAEHVRSLAKPRLSVEVRYRRRAWAPHVAHDEALLDAAPHAIDLALFLAAAAPAAVRARRLDDLAVELELALDRGVATIRCSLQRPYRERVVVRNDSLLPVARDLRGGLRSALATRFRAGDHPLAASIAAQLEAFARAVEGGDPGPLASAADGVAVMRVVMAARRSLVRDRAWVPA